MLRYIIGFLIVLVLIFFGVRLIFGGNKKSTTSSTSSMTLPDYDSTNAQVRFINDGPINSSEKHRTIQITVGRDSRVLDIIQGYEGNILFSQKFDNNQTAYGVFLSALNNSGFLKEKKNVKNIPDETGQCPLGFRYTYQLMDTGSSDQDKTLWSTSCTGLGNFAGNYSSVSQLFQKQIPDYNKLTQNIQFN